ncbi:hypothetical protein KDL29_06160 [bacterium]|nr:hypothetical protein [bacterium]
MINWRELDAEEVRSCVQLGLQGDERYMPSGFLDTHQWLALTGIRGISLDGGFERAQYRLAHPEDSPAPLHFASIDPASLPGNARTVNGLRTMLRSSSLPDSAIGDIYLDDRFSLALSSQVFLDDAGIEADYAASPPALSLPEERLTAASLRADAVVSAAFRVSRAEAQKAIQYGFVFSDYTVIGKRTTDLQAGQRLVYRTKGSLDIVDSGFNPRSGRSWLLIRRLTA